MSANDDGKGGDPAAGHRTQTTAGMANGAILCLTREAILGRVVNAT